MVITGTSVGRGEEGRRGGGGGGGEGGEMKEIEEKKGMKQCGGERYC